MKPELLHYGSEQLEQFLLADLPSDEQLTIEQHIERCETCRQHLHEMAAEEDWWHAASDLLQFDENDSQSDHTLQQLSSTDVASSSDHSDRQPADGIDHAASIRLITAWLLPTDNPEMLGRLGGYEIAGVIGAGGMGVVLKGFDRSLNRYVAIKVLAPHLATSGAARQRFAREAQAAAAVVHNNVVAIHGVDDTGDLPFLVMPYLRGTSLQKRIDRSGALSLSETLRIALQTARGLAAAHDQGLVHRDIKPANILLDGTTERVLLTDFGLARAADDASLTHSGVIAGTPYYMSPEQAEGAAIDHRSDLFSLGSVLYAMCTGRPPFRADTSWGILRRVTDSEPHPIRDVNPDVPEWLCRIIERLHCKHPGSRYQSADEVASLLEDCLAHVQQPDRFELPECVRETESAPVGQFSRIRKLAISAAVALAASLVAIAAWPDKEAQMHSQAPAPVTSNSRHANPEDGSLTTRPNQNELNQTSVSSAQSDLNALPDASDESLLSWDDTTDELSEIRSAVQQLDDDTLNLLSEKPQVEPDDR